MLSYYFTVVTFNNYNDFTFAVSVLSGIKLNYIPFNDKDTHFYHLFFPSWFDSENHHEAKYFFGRLDSAEILYNLNKRSLRLPFFK